MSSVPTPSLIQTGCIGTIVPDMAGKTRPELIKTIGERLELLRKAMGWENQFIAQQIGISPQKWRNYKKGANVLPPDVALRLCLVTGCNADFLYRAERGALPETLIKRLQEVEHPKRGAKRA